MMTNSNCESLQLNFLTNYSNHLDTEVQVMPDFSVSPWYSNIVYVLQNLQAPAGLSKTRARSVKIIFSKYCILNDIYIGKILAVFY